MDPHVKSAARAPKKAYQTPKLATHGSVEKLTLHDHDWVHGYSDIHKHPGQGW